MVESGTRSILMPAVLNQVELAFTGECAKGFILGAIRNSFSGEVGIALLREKVRQQWGSNPAHFEELMRALYALAESKYIQIIGPHSMMERNHVCVLQRP